MCNRCNRQAYSLVPQGFTRLHFFKPTVTACNRSAQSLCTKGLRQLVTPVTPGYTHPFKSVTALTIIIIISYIYRLHRLQTCTPLSFLAVLEEMIYTCIQKDTGQDMPGHTFRPARMRRLGIAVASDPSPLSAPVSPPWWSARRSGDGTNWYAGGGFLGLVFIGLLGRLDRLSPAY